MLRAVHKHLHCFALVIIDTIVIAKVAIDIIVVVTATAICQLLQKDLTIVEHLNFDFDSITLHQMDSAMDDGSSTRSGIDSGLVPLPSCLLSFDWN